MKEQNTQNLTHNTSHASDPESPEIDQAQTIQSETSSSMHVDNQDSESKKSSFQSELKEKILGDKARYITALALIGALIAILSIDSPLLTCAILAALCIIGVKEALNLYQVSTSWHYYLATIVVWILAYFNDRVIESALVMLIIYASILAYTRAINPKGLLIFIYPVLPFLSIWALYHDAGGAGGWVIIWLLVIVVFTDTGAYFGGKAFGKTPFCPVSPNKTLEGVVCGVVCGVIFGSLVGIGTSGNFLHSLLVTFIVSIVSVFGDLFESYLKREARVKDSGNIFPGHGGVLDRLDAVLFAGVAMHFLLFFLPGYKVAGITL